ncbi:MAG: hypothetical protein CM1200mP40_22630 [Gammaproteobacteria bacterium]|nr:MAG: hypothetical protein CM1200mP40_22630 [Gammaproteobacteria bacterium]
MSKFPEIMAIHIKTSDDVAKMRVAGQLAAEVLEMIGPHVSRESVLASSTESVMAI